MRFFTFFAVIISFSMHAQFAFNRTYDVIVTDNSAILKRAWEGGLSYPIFNNVDVDDNGVLDLLSFDKSGNRLVVFKNNNLVFAPFSLNIKLRNWVFFRDFNCDGLLDVFTAAPTGIAVYENKGEFNYELTTAFLKYTNDLNQSNNIYVANTDVPAIEDMDGDGDLDILAFDTNGERVVYFENQSSNGTSNCGLDYAIGSQCWGAFSESATDFTIALNSNCVSNESTESSGNHAGSNITAFDQNNDGDFDLMLSDIDENNLVYLNNNASNGVANINQIDASFPIYNNPANVYLFPYASYVDANNDGKKDLLVASSNTSVGDDKSFWFYENTGTLNDTFNYKTNAFLINEMLDFGTNAYPVACDENQDGLTDFIVGSSGTRKNDDITATLTLLRNVGTLTEPAFEVVTNDYLQLSENNLAYLYPTIGDVDGDNDDDMLIGLANGKILYLQNQAGDNNSYSFLIANPEFEDIDVGNFAAPALFDVDKNGSLDLTIGEEEGSLVFFANQSTNGFNYSIRENNFGGISTKNDADGYFLGYSTPYFYEANGITHLFVGGESGEIKWFNDFTYPNGAEVAATNDNILQLVDGTHSSLAISNLNADDFPEILVGNLAGGLAFYEGIEPTSNQVVKKVLLNITQTITTITVHHDEVKALTIFNLSGQSIVSSRTNMITKPTIPGVYILNIQVGNKIENIKFIFQQ